MRLSFGRFVFDSDAREVRREGSPVALTPKAFQLLDLLIRNHARAVSKSEIHEALWPRTFVSDASLSNLVAELRAALEDPARAPRLVRTVRSFGYAFVGELSPSQSPGTVRRAPRLVWASKEIELPAGETLLGREDSALVWIDDASVSRRHARILVSDDGAVLEDLGSKNGTKLNDELLASPVRLADGDRIGVGRADLVFRESSSTRSTQTARASSRSRGPLRRRS
jgi:DNA-binding winged helix-turn-helix (wHTH) protein